MPHPQEIAGRNVRDYEGKKCRFHYTPEVFGLSFQGCSLGQLGVFPNLSNRDQEDDRLKDPKLKPSPLASAGPYPKFWYVQVEKTYIFAKLLLYGGDRG